MRKCRWMIAAFLTVAGLSVTSSAVAFPGQGSCGEAAQNFSVPLAQSQQAGEFVSALAKQGQADDVSEELHMTLCT